MKFAYALAAAGLMAAGATAQDGSMLSTVNEAGLQALAEDAGHEILGYGEAGEVSVRAETPDGLIYYLTGTACADGECSGINMSARFDAAEVVTLEKINAANLRRAAVSVWLLTNDDGTDTLGISRYVILDGGMTQDNIEINMENFLAIVPTVIDMFYEGEE